MSYRILTLGEAEEWNNLINKLPIEQQDVYFSPEYYSLYENLRDGKAMCFVFEQGANIALYPYLLNSVNKLGYDLDREYFDIQGCYGYNGIVSNCNNNHFINNFWDEFDIFCKDQNIIAEFTRLHPLINQLSFFSEKHTVIFDRKTVYLDLSRSEEDVFNSFQYSTKRQIKRATNRFALTTKIINPEHFDIEEIYSIYRGTMNRNEAEDYLYFNKQYFSELFKLPGSVVFIALHENKPVSVIFGFKRGNYFHGHLSGNMRDYMHMSPSSLLYWEMFKYAKNEGCKLLHLGGGDSSDEENPLLKFKMNFSKDLSDFYIAKRIHNIEIYRMIVSQWEKRTKQETISRYNNWILKYRY